MKKYSKPQLTVVSFKFENGYQASGGGDRFVNMAINPEDDTYFNETTQQQNWQDGGSLFDRWGN